ncbi:MAG: TonB-dependent receptor [Gemmatimonadales bacterium]|nr:TonB-dependent receptor [Gemmatimonadales bacterium]
MRTHLAVLVGASTALVAATATPRPLTGQQAAPQDTARAQRLDSLVSTGRHEDLIGVARTASEGSTGRMELLMRPRTREGELLETVPGLILTQHSGDGKANQMFVRGFNLDHGTDFATRVEGMPVNLPTHAHGQGYTDVNFLIPELVERVDYRLGVSYAELGDFGSAGGADLTLASRLARPFASAGAGAFGDVRGVAGGSIRAGPGTLLLGGEVRAYDGPWVRPQALRKRSGLLRYGWDAGASSFSVMAMAYANRWDASDQIPARAVDGAIGSRFGQVDSTLGGAAQRFSLSGAWRHAGRASVQVVRLYGIWSDFDLYSNFTYFLADPVAGDQFNQREQRAVFGLDARHAQGVRALGAAQELTLGLQGRTDMIRGLGLFRTRRRDRVATVREDDVTQWSAGAYVQVVSRWTGTLRTTLGLRGDAYLFDVAAGRPENAGSARAAIASPKASIAYAPSSSVEFYLGGGFGFHSNDARGTTITVDPVSGAPAPRVDPLVRSRGAEVGARVQAAEAWRSTLALWALGLDSELLFVGDGGTTEPSFPSRRVGMTWTNAYRPVPALSLDLDISLARARFRGVPAAEERIPGALEHVVAAGVAWRPPEGRGPYAAARVRHFGSYALTGDNGVRATPTTLVNALCGWRVGAARVELSLLNVFDARARDVQYVYASRLANEPASGVGDVHFHPAEPRQLRAAAIWGL